MSIVPKEVAEAGVVPVVEARSPRLSVVEVLESQQVRQDVRALLEQGMSSEALQELLRNPDDFALRGSAARILLEQVVIEKGEALEVDRERLEKMWAAMTPPWVEALLEPLEEVLIQRLESNVPWTQLAQDLRVEKVLRPKYMLVVDQNGCSKTLLMGTPEEKALMSNELNEQIFSALKKVEGSLMTEQTAGDCGKVASDSVADLLSAMKDMVVCMIIDSIAEDVYEDGTRVYPLVDLPDGRRVVAFQFSTGVVKADPQNPKDVITVRAYSGDGQRRGVMATSGALNARGVAFQTDAKPGETLVDEATAVDLEALGFKVEQLPDGRGARVLNFPETSDEGHSTVSEGRSACPRNPLIALKVMEFLHSVTPFTGREALHDVLDVEAEPTAILSPFYMAMKLINVKSAEDDDARRDQFLEALVKEGTGSQQVQPVKTVDGSIHLMGRRIQEGEFAEVNRVFIKKMHRLARAHGFQLRISTGLEDALEIVVVPGHKQVDFTGPSILRTVRGLYADHPGEWVSLSREVCEAMGLRDVEYITVHAKGESYQVLRLPIREDGTIDLMASRLFGFEELEEAIHHHIDHIGENGLALCIGTVEALRGKEGVGRSALIRHAALYARQVAKVPEKNILHLSREGGGEVALFEGLVQRFGVDTIDDLIQNPQLFDDQTCVLLLDEDVLTDAEIMKLDQLLTAIAGRSVVLIHTDAYRFTPQVKLEDGQELAHAYSTQRVDIQVTTLENACRLVRQSRPEIDFERYPGRLEQLLGSLEVMWSRQLIHSVAPALVESEGTLNFDEAILKKVYPGQIALRLEKAQLGEDHRFLLGVIGFSGLPMTAAQLHEIYKYLRRDIPFEAFEKLLKSLLADASAQRRSDDRFLLQNNVEGEAVYVLKYRGDRRGAAHLARKAHERLATYLHERAYFRSDGPFDPYLAQIELGHRLTLASPHLDVDTMTLLEAFAKHQIQTYGASGACGIYRRFLHSVGDLPSVEAGNAGLYLDMAWALLQSQDAQDLLVARQVLEHLQQAGEALTKQQEQEVQYRLSYVLLMADVDQAPALARHDEALLARLAACKGENPILNESYLRLRSALRREPAFGRFAAEMVGEADGFALATRVAHMYQLASLYANFKVFSKNQPEEADLKARCAALLTQIQSALAEVHTAMKSCDWGETNFAHEQRANTERLLGAIHRMTESFRTGVAKARVHCGTALNLYADLERPMLPQRMDCAESEISAACMDVYFQHVCADTRSEVPVYDGVDILIQEWEEKVVHAEHLSIRHAFRDRLYKLWRQRQNLCEVRAHLINETLNQDNASEMQERLAKVVRIYRGTKEKADALFVMLYGHAPDQNTTFDRLVETLQARIGENKKEE